MSLRKRWRLAVERRANDPGWWRSRCIWDVGEAVLLIVCGFIVNPTEQTPPWLFPGLKFVLFGFGLGSALFALLSAYFWWTLTRRK